MEIPNLDILVIGCGPAGLSAAINGKIRNKKVAVYGGLECSPRLARAPHVDNYLGFYNVSGQFLRNKYIEHVKALDIEVNNEKIDNIYPMGDSFNVVSKGNMIICKSIVLAVGVETSRYLPGEKELLGKGVSYCATCDGGLYKGRDVGVIGHYEQAEEELSFLESLANKVYYIPLYRSVGDISNDIEVINKKPSEIVGEDQVEGVMVDDELLKVDGLFILKQNIPPSDLLPSLKLEKNAIVVDRSMKTNIEGVFAAGDCTGAPYQLAKAVGEGAVAGLSAVSYVENLEKQKK